MLATEETVVRRTDPRPSQHLRFSSYDSRHPLTAGTADWSLSPDLVEDTQTGERGWLRDALTALDDIRRGIEVDGPIPTDEALTAAVALLRALAGTVDSVPGVVDDPARAVGVEFAGVGRNRVLFVVEKDGSASYNEFIAGRSAWGRFPRWQLMMEAIGWRGLERAGVVPSS